jgi:hypothetical protein
VNWSKQAAHSRSGPSGKFGTGLSTLGMTGEGVGGMKSAGAIDTETDSELQSFLQVRDLLQASRAKLEIVVMCQRFEPFLLPAAHHMSHDVHCKYK